MDLVREVLDEASISSTVCAARLFYTSRNIFELYCDIVMTYHKETLKSLPLVSGTLSSPVFLVSLENFFFAVNKEFNLLIFQLCITIAVCTLLISCRRSAINTNQSFPNQWQTPTSLMWTSFRGYVDSGPASFSIRCCGKRKS